MGKFKTGRLLVTMGVSERMVADGAFATFVQGSLDRHGKGDWGELSDDDKLENEFALVKELRLCSVYQQQNQPTIWVITEADRCATTVLFPSEY